jgi:hypothetical protein
MAAFAERPVLLAWTRFNSVCHESNLFTQDEADLIGARMSMSKAIGELTASIQAALAATQGRSPSRRAA